MSAIFATVFALAMVASAGPTSPLTHHLQEQQCGNGNKISCCNSESNGSSNGLLSNVLNGLNCVDIPIIAVPILNQCSGSNVAACCSQGDDNDSLISLSCFPITL